MEASQDIPVRRFEAGRFEARADPVVNEARVELDVNDGRLRLAMLCLPRELEALAAGFLRGEGVLRRREDLREVAVSPDWAKVLIRGDFDEEALEAIHRRWTWGTGCGRGGTSRDVDSPAYAPVGPGPVVSARKVLDLLRQFERRTTLWRATGGVHACGLCDGERLLLFAEDVGRHNAFDKVMGKALLEGVEVGDKLAVMTGRLSAEIVSKAVACGVPVLASRSAPTGLSVDLARRFGLTLIGFARGERLNVYTGFERVTA